MVRLSCLLAERVREVLVFPRPPDATVPIYRLPVVTLVELDLQGDSLGKRFAGDHGHPAAALVVEAEATLAGDGCHGVEGFIGHTLHDTSRVSGKKQPPV